MLAQNYCRRLTRDRGGLVKDLGDLWVHGNDVIAFECNLLVSQVHLLLHPCLERLSYDRIDYVREVASTKL